MESVKFQEDRLIKYTFFVMNVGSATMSAFKLARNEAKSEIRKDIVASLSTFWFGIFM